MEPGVRLWKRPSEKRGFFDHGWLKTYHTFSFGDYIDPHWMGFRSLRVINEDVVAPGRGFPKHPHKDMEIFTYVLSGALQHQDSMGNSSVIQAGEVQKMTAGSGIFHSEFNHSQEQPVHLLQIWILPNRKGLTPSYQQFTLKAVDQQSDLALIGGAESREGVMEFYQDVRIYRGVFAADRQFNYALNPNRALWFQVIRGTVKVMDEVLTAGDGLGVEAVLQVAIQASAQAHFLLFDVA